MWGASFREVIARTFKLRVSPRACNLAVQKCQPLVDRFMKRLRLTAFDELKPDKQKRHDERHRRIRRNSCGGTGDLSVLSLDAVAL